MKKNIGALWNHISHSQPPRNRIPHIFSTASVGILNSAKKFIFIPYITFGHLSKNDCLPLYDPCNSWTHDWVRTVSKFRNKCQAIHKCKLGYIYLQTNEGAFTNYSPFVNIPAFICGFFLLSWQLFYQCIFLKRTFSAGYQMALTISANHINLNSRSWLNATVMAKSDRVPKRARVM